MEPPRLILWKVKTMDRMTRQFGERCLYLDPATLPAEQAAAVELAAGTPDIIPYRHLFSETNPNAVEHAFHGHAFSLTGTYYEDEAGNALDHVQFMDLLAGNQGVILGRSESALRFGPMKMAHSDEWNVDKANTLEHFLEVVKYLSNSKWISTPVSYQYIVKDINAFQAVTPSPQGPNSGTVSKPFNFKCPDLYTINAILALIRQLVHSDRLFVEAFEIYTHHCQDQSKVIFAHHEKTLFDHTLATAPTLYDEQYTGNDILRLFLYEFGLMHLPKPSQRKKFREMIDTYGRERTFMAFHFTLMGLTAAATRIAPLIAQDLEFWVHSEKHTGPDRVSFQEILRNDPLAPEPDRPLGMGDVRIEVSTR